MCFTNHKDYEGTWAVETKSHLLSTAALYTGGLAASWPFYCPGIPPPVADK
jgi:hypothetical protein